MPNKSCVDIDVMGNSVLNEESTIGAAAMIGTTIHTSLADIL